MINYHKTFYSNGAKLWNFELFAALLCSCCESWNHAYARLLESEG